MIVTIRETVVTVSAALCNLWDYMNPTMILFKLCNNNKILGHRFRTLYQSALELNGTELLFFAVLIRKYV